MTLNKAVPQPQYWGKGHWLWLNYLHNWHEIRQRLFFIDGTWYEWRKP